MALTEEDKDWIRTQLRNDLHDIETRLLTEFHKWASPMGARIRSHSAVLRALDLDMDTLSDRVQKIEDQLNP
jgi:hypothetical protein